MIRPRQPQTDTAGIAVSGSETLIRLATLEDAEALRDLGISSFVAAFGHLYRPADLQAFLAENYALENWKHQIGQPGRPIWLAEAPDGLLAGYAQASPCELPVVPLPDGSLQLHRLYVRPGGLSAGIGSALMSQVLDWVDAAGRPPLFLGVWSGNEGAQRFYARYGFYKVGEHHFPVGEQVDLEYTLRRD